VSLEVGKTHDVVVLVNATQELGLTVKPSTYRLGRAPEFIPRIGGGEPGAQDFDWWRAFTQRDFHLGEGPSSFDRIQGLETVARAYGAIAWPSGLGPALLPRATSMEGLTPVKLSCDDEIRIVEMSDAPRMLYKKLLLTHTDDLWVWSHTQLAGNVRSVVMHSNVMFMAHDNTGYQAYGTVFESGVVAASHNPAVYYAPAYSTDADILWNYDGKLWKGDDNKIAYLTPTTGWASELEVGSADHKILNTAVAFGRIYFGKSDALWCYEGGRVYEVEPFYGEVSDSNFKLMHATHGALYFNIGAKLYRYTGAGNIELLMSYPYEAILGPATTAQDKLYFSVRDESFSGGLYGYDFRSRGVFRELDLYSEAARDTVHDVVHITGLGVAANKLWIAPVESTVNLGMSEKLFTGAVDVPRQRSSFPLGTTSPVTRYAERATALSTGAVFGLRFSVEKLAPTIGFDLEFAIYADDGGTPGKPTGAALASVVIPEEDVPYYSFAWVTGIFATPYGVTAGTKYHFVCQTVADATGADYYYVEGDISSGSTTVSRYTGAWVSLGDYVLHYQALQRDVGPLFGTQFLSYQVSVSKGHQ